MKSATLPSSRLEDGFITVTRARHATAAKRGRPPSHSLPLPPPILDEQKHPTPSPLPPPPPPPVHPEWYGGGGSHEEKRRMSDASDSQSDEALSSSSSPPASPFRAECPLCMEELDSTDLAFHPCPCAYQLCLYCYTAICERLNAQCPACRREYDRGQALASASSSGPPLMAQAASERKDKKRQRDREKRRAGEKDRQAISAAQAALANTRIIQRNLVYVMGLPAALAHDEVLKRRDVFGRFGKITKASVARRTQPAGGGEGLWSAYVTYKASASAAAAIGAMNGSVQGGAVIRCTYGTTKYCAFFVRGAVCTNTQCLYVHEVARVDDCVTKEELSNDERMMAIAGLERQHSACTTPTHAQQQQLHTPIHYQTVNGTSPSPSSSSSHACASATGTSSAAFSATAMPSLSASALGAAISIFDFPLPPQPIPLLSSHSSAAAAALPPSVSFLSRSTSEGWAAVAAAGASLTSALPLSPEPAAPPSFALSSSSFPSAAAVAVSAPTPAWPVVHSSTSAAALLGQAVQPEPPPRRPPPGFDKPPTPPAVPTAIVPDILANGLGLPHANGDAFSVFSFPPAASSAASLISSLLSSVEPARGKWPSVPAVFPPSHPLHISAALSRPLPAPQPLLPVLGGLADSGTQSAAGESASAWDFSAFVEQLRATAGDLLPGIPPPDAVDDGIPESSPSPSSAAVVKTRAPSPHPIHQLQPLGLKRPAAAAVPSAGSGPSDVLRVIPHPLPSPSLFAEMGDALDGDVEDDWTVHADNEAASERRELASSLRPSGFDDSPPVTAWTSLRHGLEPTTASLDVQSPRPVLPATPASTIVSSPLPFPAVIPGLVSRASSPPPAAQALATADADKPAPSTPLNGRRVVPSPMPSAQPISVLPSSKLVVPLHSSAVSQLRAITSSPIKTHAAVPPPVPASPTSTTPPPTAPLTPAKPILSLAPRALSGSRTAPTVPSPSRLVSAPADASAQPLPLSTSSPVRLSGKAPISSLSHHPSPHKPIHTYDPPGIAAGGTAPQPAIRTVSALEHLGSVHGVVQTGRSGGGGGVRSAEGRERRAAGGR